MAGEADIMTLIVQHLTSQSTIKALLGNNPCKVFPGDVPLKVGGQEIIQPWVNLKRMGWEEVAHLQGGTGTYECPTRIEVQAATAQEASTIYSAVRAVLKDKWSVTWSGSLWVHRSIVDLGQQVELMGPDGAPAKWQQIEGLLELTCCVLSV